TCAGASRAPGGWSAASPRSSAWTRPRCSPRRMSGAHERGGAAARAGRSEPAPPPPGAGPRPVGAPARRAGAGGGGSPAHASRRAGRALERGHRRPAPGHRAGRPARRRTDRVAVVSQELRAGAAYVLPNALVVLAAPRDDGLPGWLLPTLLEWQRRLAPDYEVDAAHAIGDRGEPTGRHRRHLRPPRPGPGRRPRLRRAPAPAPRSDG